MTKLTFTSSHTDNNIFYISGFTETKGNSIFPHLEFFTDATTLQFVHPELFEHTVELQIVHLSFECPDNKMVLRGVGKLFIDGVLIPQLQQFIIHPTLTKDNNSGNTFQMMQFEMNKSFISFILDIICHIKNAEKFTANGLEKAVGDFRRRQRISVRLSSMHEDFNDPKNVRQANPALGPNMAKVFEMQSRNAEFSLESARKNIDAKRVSALIDAGISMFSVPSNKKVFRGIEKTTSVHTTRSAKTRAKLIPLDPLISQQFPNIQVNIFRK